MNKMFRKFFIMVLAMVMVLLDTGISQVKAESISYQDLRKLATTGITDQTAAVDSLDLDRGTNSCFGVIDDDDRFIITTGNTNGFSDGDYGTFTNIHGDSFTGTAYKCYTRGFTNMSDDDRDRIEAIVTVNKLVFGSTVYLEFGDYLNVWEIYISFENVDQYDNIYGMFENDYNLEYAYLNLTGVTKMDYMFSCCGSLEYIDFSDFDFSNVASAYSAFQFCYSLEELDLSNWKSAIVENTEDMFYDCSNLKHLDISGLDTSVYPVGDSIFYDCYSLNDIVLGPKWGNGWTVASDSADGSALPAGYWANGSRICSEEQLAENYYNNGSSWQGTWTRMLSLDRFEMSTKGMTVYWNPLSGASNYSVSFGGGQAKTTKNNYYTFTDLRMGDYYYIHIEAAANGINHYLDVFPIFNPFDDIRYIGEDFRNVSWAYNNSIIGGTSETSFSPKANCTRAQFCLMLYKMYGKPSVTIPSKLPFSDISTQTANTKKAIIWCYNKGIIAGSNGKFNPKGKIKRSQLVVMLYKLAGKPSVTGMECPFTDISSLTSNTRNAIIWAYNLDMDYGLKSVVFGPNEYGTRSQLTKMLYHYNFEYEIAPLN